MAPPGPAWLDERTQKWEVEIGTVQQNAELSPHTGNQGSHARVKRESSAHILENAHDWGETIPARFRVAEQSCSASLPTRHFLPPLQPREDRGEESRLLLPERVAVALLSPPPWNYFGRFASKGTWRPGSLLDDN